MPKTRTVFFARRGSFIIGKVADVLVKRVGVGGYISSFLHLYYYVGFARSKCSDFFFF